MRKILFPFIAIAIMASFVACSNEELLPEAIGEAEANTETTIEETRTLSITATMPGDEDPKTRVTLERDDGLGIILKWQAGDRLQFAFVQGETKVKHVLTLKAEDNITNDGKTVTFNIPLPTDNDFNPNAPFDLYGLYGYYDKTNNVGSLSGTDVTLTKTPGSRGTLERVQNRGDVMLYFESKNINPQNPIATVNFKHLGSLFAISLKNTGSNDLTGVKELRLQGVDNTDKNWAYNSGAGGKIFDLVSGQFKETDSGDNFISFTPRPEAQSTLPAEATATLWAWYPPIPNQKWPALKLQLIGDNDSVIHESTNIKPVRATAPEAGKVYHFYARWDGTLNFTDSDFNVSP